MIKTITPQTPPINKEIGDIQQAFNQYQFTKTQADESKDEDNGFYLKQSVDPHIAEFYYNKSGMVASSVDILSEDVILTNKITAISDEIDLEKINECLEELRPQLAYQYGDERLSGAGCSRIIPTHDNGFTLIQLPQKQLKLKKIKHNDGKLYTIVEQLIQNVKTQNNNFYRYYKIFTNEYPTDLQAPGNKGFTGYVTWLGESQFYNYYSIPFWYQNSELINSKICIESLDTKTFNNGNKAEGIVYFNKTGITQLQFNKPLGEEETSESDLNLSSVLPSNIENIKRELKNAGYGVAYLYDESDQNPMTMNYVKLSNDNYSYIQSKVKDIDQSVISRSGIPRERYMINDMKESMNSQKTQAFWEIYTKRLNSLQIPVEKMLRNLIKFLYDVDVEIIIEVPEFSEIINAKINTIKDLFNNALLTLRQALTLLSPYITELDINDIDIQDTLLDSRFYQGRPLTEYGDTPNLDNLGLGDLFAQT